MTETDVIYNADCPVCAAEIGAYRDHAARAGLAIRFTPLSKADLAALGLTPEAAARRLHVVQGGRLLAGLPAFRALWAEMPRYRWLARLTGLPGLRPLAGAIYERVLAPALYALHRRRLARADRACRAR
jgi:predicted DCC family thiol-disulfide oxidoreductase YuxK